MTVLELEKRLDAILEYIRTIEQHMMALEARPTTVNPPSCPRPIIKFCMSPEDYEIDEY